TLTNNTMTVGAIQNAPADPSGTATFSRPLTGFVVQTSIPGQVNLVNPTGLNLTYWDGADTVPGAVNNLIIDGGNGLWEAAGPTSNWTNVTGSTNAPWDNGGVGAIFAGIGAGSLRPLRDLSPLCYGTRGQRGCIVTVTDAEGQVTASALQFATDGYIITGQP